MMFEYLIARKHIKKQAETRREEEKIKKGTTRREEGRRRNGRTSPCRKKMQ